MVNDLHKLETNKFNDSGAVRTSATDADGNEITRDNPLPTSEIDSSGRVAINSIFGDKITGQRVPSIAAQFHYGVESDSVAIESVGTGQILLENSMLKAMTGTDTNGSASVQSTKYLRYVPGFEAWLNYTVVFTQGVPNSYQRAGLYDDTDGFYLGYEGVDFTLTHIRDGLVENSIVIDTSTIVLGSNGETFDPTKGNVYRISFGYLGFATIHYEIMTSSGTWIPLGEIPYPNTAVVTHIKNPNLPIRAECANTGNATNLEMRSGSVSAGIVDGAGVDVSARNFNHHEDDITVGSGNSAIIAFRNKSSFNGISNRIPSLLKLISCSTDTGKNVTWSILKNPSFASATWNDVNTLDSTMEFSTDIAGVDFAEETFLDWNMAKLDTFFEDITNQQLLLPPGGLAVFMVNTQAPGGEVSIAIRWAELF